MHIRILAFAALLSGCTPVTSIPTGSTPLANAVVNRQIGDVLQLLAAGNSPDSTDERGTAAIILAAETDQYEIALILATHHANIWVADNLGYTAAIFAKTSRVNDESKDGKSRLQFIKLLQSAGYPWPPPWPKDVLVLREAGRWPPGPIKH